MADQRRSTPPQGSDPSSSRTIQVDNDDQPHPLTSTPKRNRRIGQLQSQAQPLPQVVPQPPSPRSNQSRPLPLTQNVNSPAGGSKPPTRARAAPGDKASTSSTPTDRVSLVTTFRSLEREIRELRDQVSRERSERKALVDQVGKKGKGKSLDEEETSKLESFLAGLDDDAITSLLMAPSSTLVNILGGRGSTLTALRDQQIHIPALSAGIEGTGTGLEIDLGLNHAGRGRKRKRNRETREAGREPDYDRPGPDPTTSQDQLGVAAEVNQKEWIRNWLRSRKERTGSLLDHLASFTDFEMDEASWDQSHPLGSVVVRGKVLGLEGCKLTFDVEQQGGGSGQGQTRDSPRLSNLRADLPREIKEALLVGGHLERLLAKSDLPALMISIRTLLPLAKSRRLLFHSLSMKYSKLCRTWIDALSSEGVRISETTSNLVAGGKDSNARVIPKGMLDPHFAEELRFENDKGAELSLRFAVGFDRFGNASVELDMIPNLPSSVKRDPNAKQILSEFSSKFKRLVRNSSGPSNMSSNLFRSICLVVDSFYGLEH
ncbi:hypothetical protein IE53DRAFT_388500 [Violaceomyces palustris]|uniref:Uncharacterized protein n=1 Tax=Violaceomyces palustris TaxID=1673888 RepID=A0ACD0NU23_9BASI|nr:hypothetical protein IE53DRAFT_388500 [Violaceomyces palustris]